jgi:outer membrane protein OmpA-like peptidoglycan-associated protein
VSASFALVTDTVKIFYPINKYELAVADKVKLTALADSLHAADTVLVVGYTDYLGNSKDNLVLSKNRAGAIKNFMFSLNKGLVILTDGKGEVPAATARSVFGEPVNRRADIIRMIKRRDKKILAIMPVTVPPVTHPDSTLLKMPSVDLTGADKETFNNKINALATLEVGSSVSLEELTFQMGRHFLNPEAVPYVNTLLAYLKKHKNITFEIRGHICCEYGDNDGFDRDTGDQTLSENRAKFIYDYFIKKGIKANRMTYKGLGASKPKIWPERSGHDSYLNRRVEILITGK